MNRLGYQHTDDLIEAAAFDEIWTYVGQLAPRTTEALAGLTRDAREEQERGLRAPFAVIDLATGKTADSTSYRR